MKRYLYIFMIKVREVVLLSLFTFLPIGLLGGIFGSHSPLSSRLGNLGLAAGFLSAFVSAAIFHPEDSTSFEMQASLPRPFWRTIFEVLGVSLGVVWLIGGISTFTLMLLLNEWNIALMVTSAIGYAVIALFFASITLLGVISGRDSRIGLMLGLIAVAWLYAFPGILSRETKIFSLFNVLADAETYFLWGGYRIIYILFSIACLWIGIYRLRDIDALLVGTSSRGAQLKADRDRLTPQPKWQLPFQQYLSKPLRIAASRTVGLIVYEGIITVVKGPIFIAFAVFWLLFGLSSILWTLWNSNVLFSLGFGAIYLPFNLRLLFIIFLPFTIVSIASTDQRTHVEPLMLSTISPRVYVGGKILGVGAGVIICLLICSIPVTLFMIPSALSAGHPIYLVGYLGNLFLGIVPFLIYVTTISVVVGLLARSGHTLLWGGALAIGAFMVFFNTLKSIIGNIAFPFGHMLADMIAYPIYLLEHTSGGLFPPQPEHFLLVPTFYLALPVLSTVVQVFLIWLVASKIYERQVTSA
jgi:hypothetical protein